MPDTSATKQARYRARLRGEIPPAVPLLCACGKGRSGRYGMLCRDCWRKTDAGRAWNRERIALYRASRRKA